MTSMGITRRIDNLGRIVIPKELRKNLNIKEGEELEILINDSDSFVLKKYSCMNKSKEMINDVILSLKFILGFDVYIANLNMIIATTNKNFDNYELLHDLRTEKKNLLITKDLKLDDLDFIKPIVINGDVEGFIIIKNDGRLSIETELLSSFCIKIIERILS